MSNRETDDDESFEVTIESKKKTMTTYEISSDEEYEQPEVNINIRKKAICNLFPNIGYNTSKPETNQTTNYESSKLTKYSNLLKEPGVEKTIVGVKVNLPVNPYPSQMALMSTVSTIYCFIWL